MNDASNAPEAVLTSISHKEVVPQPPRSPPGEYHQTQQSTGGFPQQQYPQQQQPQQQQQQQYPEQQQYSQQQYSQQQQQQSQQHDAQPKPFDGSGYYSVTATGTPSQYGHLPASSHEEPKRPKEKTVCGLAKRTFIFIVILAVVVVGAAVGGAVGGSMAVQRSSQPQAATLSAASSSAAATPTTTVPQESTTTGGGSSTTPTSAFVQVPSEYGQLKLDCPNLDGTTKKLALDGTTWSFALECGVDFPGAKNDILALTVYTLDDCLRGCLSYNRNLGRPDCVGVAFNADMASNVNRNFGNCWVKNSTGTVRTNNSNRNVGALLQLK